MEREAAFAFISENPELVKAWIEQNLLMKNEAMKITQQSSTAFGQAVDTGRIKSFVEFGDKRKTKWYLKADLLDYAKNKKKNSKQ
ncbi:hypothetical protein [Cytobacillus pseudoceanisediminis]|uniref:hypothetical protein n=1 Tax=Cytobacillus pseudoceanisediminis TaxID=3051614 RepID=UPI003C2F4C88